MIVEAFAIPVLMKAVDFLFGETQKILEERRLARQKPDSEAAAPPDIPLLELDKETVLHRKVSQELAERQAEAIEALLEEINIYQRNRQRLEKRAALEGGKDFAPISVINQLHAQEDAILERSRQLAGLLDNLTRQGQ